MLNESILKELGIDKLPPEEQEQIILAIGKTIFESVLVRVIQLLDDQDLDEFEKLMTENPNDQQALLSFLQAKVPDFNQIVAEEVSKFKHEILTFSPQLNQ